MLMSIVTPAFNEAANLPVLHERLSAVMRSLEVEWEWVIVDDHSRDDTFAVITELAERDPRVRGLRFARNFGSHAALTCGLHQAAGECVVALAADLQDPPDVIPALLAEWRGGAQVVWAARRERAGETTTTLALSRLYHWVMRSVVDLNEMPATGADFFLLDRGVVDAFARFSEGNTSILALLSWMGFRQATITYDKAARLHGRSGWTLKKKLELVANSVTSFSYVPIRFMSYLGLAIGFLGFVYAAYVVVNAIAGEPIAGWSSLMVVVLLLGGFQMVMLGVLGEYVWRALDEARRRPRYIIEHTTHTAAASSSAGAVSDRREGR